MSRSIDESPLSDEERLRLLNLRVDTLLKNAHYEWLPWQVTIAACSAGAGAAGALGACGGASGHWH